MGIVRAFTVILLKVILLATGIPLTAGPSPFATALAVMVPVGVIGFIAFTTFVIGILVENVIFTLF
jgi:hypothetical protein